MEEYDVASFLFLSFLKVSDGHGRDTLLNYVPRFVRGIYKSVDKQGPYNVNSQAFVKKHTKEKKTIRSSR